MHRRDIPQAAARLRLQRFVGWATTEGPGPGAGSPRTGFVCVAPVCFRNVLNAAGTWSWTRPPVQLAETLKLRQPAVAEHQKKADIFISTLRRFIEARGGQLETCVLFPEGDVKIIQFEERNEDDRAAALLACLKRQCCVPVPHDSYAVKSCPCIDALDIGKQHFQLFVRRLI